MKIKLPSIPIGTVKHVVKLTSLIETRQVASVRPIAGVDIPKECFACGFDLAYECFDASGQLLSSSVIHTEEPQAAGVKVPNHFIQLVPRLKHNAARLRNHILYKGKE